MLAFSVTLLITVVNVGVLYFVLRKILFKPVSKFMSDRSRRVEEDLQRAAEERERAAALRAEYELNLNSAKDEADRIRAEALDAARVQAEAVLERARAEAARLVEAARGQIEVERAAAAALFKAEAAALVLAATARLLHREVDAEDSLRAAQEFLAEAGGV